MRNRVDGEEFSITRRLIRLMLLPVRPCYMTDRTLRAEEGVEGELASTDNSPGAREQGETQLGTLKRGPLRPDSHPVASSFGSSLTSSIN